MVRPFSPFFVFQQQLEYFVSGVFSAKGIFIHKPWSQLHQGTRQSKTEMKRNVWCPGHSGQYSLLFLCHCSCSRWAKELLLKCCNFWTLGARAQDGSSYRGWSCSALLKGSSAAPSKAHTQPCFKVNMFSPLTSEVSWPPWSSHDCSVSKARRILKSNWKAHTFWYILIPKLYVSKLVHSLPNVVWRMLHVKARAAGVGRTAEIILMTSSARKCFEVV